MTFPNLKGKHAKDALVTPKEYFKYKKKLGEYLKFRPPESMIFIYSDKFLANLLRKYKLKKVKFFKREIYLLKGTNVRIGLMKLPAWGAPVTASMMEMFIECGIKKFLIVGMAGSLQKNLEIGDFIICDKAIRDEGTSHHYIKSGKYAYPSAGFVKKIENTFKKNNTKYVKGATWTVDAIFRETIAEVRQYKKEGVLTVEMEAAALFSIAKYRGVEAGAIFTISDYLGELDWQPKFHLTDKYLEKLFLIAKDVLS